MIKSIKKMMKRDTFLYRMGLHLLNVKSNYKLWRRKKHFEEKHCKWGKENPDKTFYIIRRSNYYVGWGSMLSVIIGRIAESEVKGWIPVVDLKNEKNAYLEDDEIGKKDAWEYYFQPLCGYGLDDIKHSKNIILSDGGENIELLSPGDFDKKHNEDLFYKWRGLTKKYIRFREDVEDKMKREMEELFEERDKVVGILARGTDYTARKPKGHPVQPELEQLFERTEWVEEKFQCNKIFLATEDKNIYQKFIAKFGKEKVVVNKKAWIDYKGSCLLSELSGTRENDRYLSGLEYLTTLYILSKCPCIIGGRTSAIPLVMCMTESPEYTYFWDLGVY